MEKFSRKKKSNFINSFFYIFDKFLPINNKKKLKLYLNLQFIFYRLAHEKSYIKFQYQHPTTQYTIKNIRQFIKKNYKILDVGSGNGYIAYNLSNNVKQIVCIDNDKSIIRNAKKKFKKKNIQFICDDLKNLHKYNHHKFDLIVCSHIIEHLYKPFSFLNSLKKYNSKIYIEVPDFENDVLNSIKKKINYNLLYSDNDHIYEFDRNYLLKNLKKNKFKIINQIYKNGVISLLIK